MIYLLFIIKSSYLINKKFNLYLLLNIKLIKKPNLQSYYYKNGTMNI